MEKPDHSNRLVDETSPYLRQHAHQPVDWYPWGEEALSKAKRENKPIFLSIGYSACHWCHVMARESFDDPSIARKMNEGFINIKVDREERPDVDALYMKSLVAMQGQGGWPLSLFLTPDQEPFFGGTYFPPNPRSSQPGFPQILDQALQRFFSSENPVQTQGQDILKSLQPREPTGPVRSASAKELMNQAVAQVADRYDENYGGFGGGMKFPEPMLYSLLLRHWWGQSANDSIMMVDWTLTRMAEGGIYDQLGGGFHRYSTDRYWRVPHFEKMLYDNALLARLYLQTWQATQQEIYERIPREVFQYVLREMTSPEGGFYSSQSAITGEGEGHYYLWEMKEVLDLLGPRPAQVFARAYGITAGGNFQKKNVLVLQESMEKVAEKTGVPIFEVDHIIKSGRQTLLEIRQRREIPERDEKILTGWNGMMIGSLALGYTALQDTSYLEAAERCADFIWETMRQNNVLRRVFKEGQVSVPGVLEDYAWLLDGLVALFEASSEVRWLERSVELADEMIDRFLDEEDGGFFMTGTHQEALRIRLKEGMDEAYSSSNAVAAMALLRLGRLTGKTEYSQRAGETLNAFQMEMAGRPAACTGLLAVKDFLESPPIEIVLSGPEEDREYQEMRKVADQAYRPNQLRVLYRGEETVKAVPWAEGRGPVAGKPTAYVCKDHTCHPPVHTAEALYNLLGRPPHINLNIFDEEKHVQDMQSREQANFLNAMTDIFKHSGLGGK